MSNLFKKKENKQIDRLYLDSSAIPKEIKIIDLESTDIRKIDQIIKHKFITEKSRLHIYEKQLDQKVKEFESSKSRVGRITLMEEMKKLEASIDDIREEKTKKQYMEESKILLDMLDKKSDIFDIENFIKVARKYIKIDIVFPEEEEKNCKSCGNCIEDEIIEGSVICSFCGALNEYVDSTLYIKDINNIPTYLDEELHLYSKCLDKYEGRIYHFKTDILFPELDNYFEAMGVEERNEIRKKDTVNGRKDGTNKQLMWDALDRLGYNIYADEINSILHFYWGWDLPVIGKYRNLILELHERTQRVWDSVKENYRKKKLNDQFRMFQEFNAVGYIVRREDFRFQDSLESIQMHNEAWKYICEVCEIEFRFIA